MMSCELLTRHGGGGNNSFWNVQKKQTVRQCAWWTSARQGFAAKYSSIDLRKSIPLWLQALETSPRCHCFPSRWAQTMGKIVYCVFWGGKKVARTGRWDKVGEPSAADLNVCVNGNPADENRRGRVVPLAGNGYFLQDKSLSFSYSLLLLSIWEQVCKLNSLLAIAKTQQTSRAIFQDFSPGKRTFESSIQNSSTANFEIVFFGKPHKKNVALSFRVWGCYV